jgi:membrane fusion protein (multidrug efflux system)
LVVGSNGEVERRSVRVSRTIGDQWLVEHGLTSGERVVVEGVQKVAPRMKMQAVLVQQAPVPKPAAVAGSMR